MLLRIAALLKRIRRAQGATRPGGLAGGMTISPDVRASLNQDGVVFLQLRSGTVFRSNRIGAAIWRGLMDRQELAVITSRIARDHAVSVEQVSQDATRFLAQLEDSGFLVRQAGA